MARDTANPASPMFKPPMLVSAPPPNNWLFVASPLPQVNAPPRRFQVTLFCNVMVLFAEPPPMVNPCDRIVALVAVKVLPPPSWPTVTTPLFNRLVTTSVPLLSVSWLPTEPAATPMTRFEVNTLAWLRIASVLLPPVLPRIRLPRFVQVVPAPLMLTASNTLELKTVVTMAVLEPENRSTRLVV